MRLHRRQEEGGKGRIVSSRAGLFLGFFWALIFWPPFGCGNGESPVGLPPAAGGSGEVRVCLGDAGIDSLPPGTNLTVTVSIAETWVSTHAEEDGSATVRFPELSPGFYPLAILWTRTADGLLVARLDDRILVPAGAVARVSLPAEKIVWEDFDSDGDFSPNLEEIRKGSDPDDPDSPFRLAKHWGFEEGSLPEPWQAHADSGVSGDKAFLGEYSAMMYDGGGSNLAELWTEFAPIHEGKVEFRLFPTHDGPAGCGVSLSDDQGSEEHPNHRFYMHIQPGDRMMLWHGQDNTRYAFEVPAHLPVSLWYHLVIVWQEDVGRARVYLDGTRLGTVGTWSPVGMEEGDAPEGGRGISEFRIQGGSSSGTGDLCFLDEVRLFSADAP